MSEPDFAKEVWHCNGCEDDFEVETGSYNLDKGDWPECPECKSDSTELL